VPFHRKGRLTSLCGGKAQDATDMSAKRNFVSRQWPFGRAVRRESTCGHHAGLCVRSLSVCIREPLPAPPGMRARRHSTRRGGNSSGKTQTECR
jgi:hypothetical protein